LLVPAAALVFCARTLTHIVSAQAQPISRSFVFFMPLLFRA